MASRRMFAKSVVDSARFLRMPQTSRLLYYDLGMAADDDGVVEAFTVLRTTGAAEDDLRVLASKGFVKVLNDDLVSYITDWSVNNQLRKDRYHPSVYRELLVQVVGQEVVATNGLPDGNQMATESSQGYSSQGYSSQVQSIPTESEVQSFCDEEGIEIDVKKFWSHYNDLGWTSGGQPIKSWKSLVRKWEETGQQKSETFVPGPQEQAYYKMVREKRKASV